MKTGQRRRPMRADRRRRPRRTAIRSASGGARTGSCGPTRARRSGSAPSRAPRPPRPIGHRNVDVASEARFVRRPPGSAGFEPASPRACLRRAAGWKPALPGSRACEMLALRKAPDRNPSFVRNQAQGCVRAGSPRSQEVVLARCPHSRKAPDRNLSFVRNQAQGCVRAGSPRSRGNTVADACPGRR